MIGSSDGAVDNQKLPAYDFKEQAAPRDVYGSSYAHNAQGFNYDPDIAERVGWRK